MWWGTVHSMKASAMTKSMSATRAAAPANFVAAALKAGRRFGCLLAVRAVSSLQQMSPAKGRPSQLRDSPAAPARRPDAQHPSPPAACGTAPDW